MIELQQQAPPQEQQQAPPGVGDQPIIDADPIQSEAPQQSDSEARARALGWVPQDEFRGDPSRWRSAEEYIERGYNEPAIARATIERLQSRIEAQEREFGTRLRGIERMSEVALSRQREQLLANYDTAIRNAAEIGDMAKFDQLMQARKTAVQDHDLTVAEQRWNKPAPPKQGTQPTVLPPSDQAVVDTWVANNKWFTSDSEMAAVADMASKRINREHPGLTAAQNLAEVTRYMQHRYPEKFAARPAPNGSPVESGNRQPLGRSSAAAKLPPEALAQAQAYIKKGLIKSVEEYAATYNE